MDECNSNIVLSFAIGFLFGILFVLTFYIMKKWELRQNRLREERLIKHFIKESDRRRK